MKTSIFWRLTYFTLLFVAVLTGACTKSIEGLVEDPSTSRAFIPTNFRVRASADTAILSWNAGAQSAGMRISYTLDISTDSAFASIDYSKVVDSSGIKIIDPALTVGKSYFARLRANAVGNVQPSRWVYYPSSFRITGLQFLRVIRSSDITDQSVSLNWFVDPQTASLDKVILSTDNNQVTTVPLTAAEAAAGTKTIAGLAPGTRYTVQILTGTKSKGLGMVTTLRPANFTRILNPGDNLATAITSAVDGDLIGLNPGTYAMTGIVDIVAKNISIKSVSNNPATTKLKLRELNLKGDGAGIVIAGLELDANYSGTSFGATLLQLKGQSADNAAAVFKSITIENCIVHDFTTNILRGNYGAAADTHKLNSFVMSNCIVYDINKTGSNSTYTFSIEKLGFTVFNLNRSTLYNLGAGLVNVSTILGGGAVPVIVFDYTTINNIGSQGRYVLIDAGSQGAGNNVSFSFQNSILANTPLGVGGLAVSGTPHLIRNQNAVGNFVNSNYFNLFTARVSEGGFKLVLTGLYQFNNNEIDLGWSAATRDFSLKSLPSNSPLLKGSTNGNTIGDPRWAF